MIFINVSGRGEAGLAVREAGTLSLQLPVALVDRRTEGRVRGGMSDRRERRATSVPVCGTYIAMPGSPEISYRLAEVTLINEDQSQNFLL